MLKLIYLSENFALAKAALQNWPHDPATLEKRLMHFRIFSNAVYPFDYRDGPGFLRLTPAAEKSAEAIRAELAFLTYLQAEGYPALRPIPAVSGETLLTLETPWGAWHACTFTGVPGRPMEDVPLTEEVLLHYGAALGRLHALSMAYEPAQRRPTCEDALAWVSEMLADAPDFLRQECRTVADLLRHKPKTRQNYGLVHYDFEPDNVFYDGETCHVIDFDDSMEHFYAIDLVQALDELPPEAAAPFLRGYASACPDSQADAADFPLMRRFRDLYSYARLQHALSERPAPLPDWMPPLIARLEHKARMLEEQIQLR